MEIRARYRDMNDGVGLRDGERKRYGQVRYGPSPRVERRSTQGQGRWTPHKVQRLNDRTSMKRCSSEVKGPLKQQGRGEGSRDAWKGTHHDVCQARSISQAGEQDERVLMSEPLR